MPGLLLIPLILLFAVGAVGLSLAASVNRHSWLSPHNAPEAWIRAHGLPADEPPRSHPLAVCAGDSIGTHPQFYNEMLLLIVRRLKSETKA